MLAMDSERPAQPQVPMQVGRMPVTLEPLRTLGPDALETQGIQVITKITLHEIEITSESAFHHVTILRADDLFASPSALSPAQQIPVTGRITRAVLMVYFADSPNPITVQISVPNRITLSPGHDTEIVERWLSQCHFIDQQLGAPNANAMAGP
jgi:hypothetical protein